MELTELQGIGPVRAESLRAMGIYSLRDLLYTLPIRYEDRLTEYSCSVKNPGNIMIRGSFIEPLKSSFFRGVSRITGTFSDHTGRLPVCWYNEPWIIKNIPVGKEILLFGRLSVKNGKRLFQNPSIVTETGWIPVYKTIRQFPAKSFRKLITSALEKVNDCCPETLPDSFRLQYHLCELNFAIRQAHFPDNPEFLQIARRRLSFENILIYLMYITSKGKKRQNAYPMSLYGSLTEEYWNSLSFSPTASQKKVLEEIAADLRKNVSMARLVQGDVGCGKTAVAFGSIYLACKAGFQASMMAPTEILAVQHYENARKTLEPSGIKCCLLTGNTRGKERKRILEEIASGSCQAVFGTHALISKDVKYNNPGLVITDEQHRFGVNQRTTLQEKGKSDEGIHPHVLVMSATPIPRTLALILYGDLDLSVIDEMPSGRKEVKTRMVPESRRAAMYDFLRKELQKGSQAYVVCPLVEDGEQADELKSAKTVYEELKNNELKDISIALTWGNQKSDEKAAVLHGFMQGDYKVLISTTVIEVGVNNPNATIMIIENAERFGLSQLHQLRGRVGRGLAESWCFLLSDDADKLRILCSTNDGFVISQKDLEMRGPGDLLGTRQSGDIFTPLLGGDALLLDEVSKAVRNLYSDPSQNEICRKIEAHVFEYFSKTGHLIAMN